MKNVIREDIISIGFDIDSGALNELKQIGHFGGRSLRELQTSAKGAGDGMEGAKKQASKLQSQLTTLGKKGAAMAFNGLKKIAGISFKATVVGVTAIAGAVGKMSYEAVQAYADFEQLKGGVETLFGAKGAKSVEEYAKYTGKSVSEVKKEYDTLIAAQDKVLANADNAWMTAGLSANDYMSTVTTFSASLIKSLNGDTTRAAELSDVALQDMADNANKMGTDISMIQSAYSGIARGNYMMLDNLKLGYAGSKTELERLLSDAEKIKAKMGETVDYDVSSYADVIEAIHTIQENMGITGTTAKEAKETVTGSLNAMRAAYKNLLIAMGSGEGLDKALDNMVQTVETFMGNVIPVVEKSLGAMGKIVERIAPMIEEKLPALAEQLLPPLIKAAVSLTQGLIKALPSIIKTLATTVVDIFGEQFPIIKKIGDLFSKNADKIAKFIPVLVALAAAFSLFSKIKSVTSVFSGLFGGNGGEGGTNGGGLGGITNIFSSLAKTKPTTILKGMANLAIILGGLTVLTALFMAVAPQMAELSDAKTVFKVIAIIGALGLVGGALTILAGFVGKIPVSTVALGLANIAIIVAGMSALYLLIGAVSLINFDLKRILAIVGVVGVLGTVGAALTLFAGIVGMIPITAVLMGLANIALVMAGLTALVIAFGALTRVEGLEELIAKGGDLIADLFGIIGKIAGSLIGNLGEAVSESLPVIGSNLAKFAKNVKPLFTICESVDMGGFAQFFGALGNFMLKMAANDIVARLTGGTDLTELGTELSNFAAGAQVFFQKIAAVPENAFTNATKLFEALSGLGGLPNSGGVVGWFCGDIDYSAIANGLKTLSGEGVKKFLQTVSAIAPETFEKVTQFFESLSGIGDLPNTGGVAGWFCGDIDYTQIASGLAALGGEGVKKFFTMAQGLSPEAFENVKLLFDALGTMGDSLPEKDNWWDKLWGNESVSLGDIATDLGTFAKNSKSFFNMVNKLNLSNLNGMWDSFKKAEGLTASISKVVDENIDDIVSKIKELPKTMGDALKNAGKPLADSFVEVWKAAVKASVAPVNKLLAGANHILKEFGSKKTVIEWQPYARGTGGHRGGNALVNDGNGAELVQMPNGHTFIPNGRNVFIPNAPKGMKVLPANQTAKLLGRRTPTFNYANGTGDIDIWSYYDNAKGLVEKITEGISYKGMNGLALNLGQSMVSTFADEMPAWIDKLFSESGQSISSYVSSKGVMQWLPTVARALKMEGVYSLANVARTLFQMRTESGGNPHAINLWDSNAKKGVPSKGLMQVIDPTFRAYARSGFNTDIYDPLSNVLASVRYAKSRYGSLARAYRGVGYANGVGTISLPSQASTMSLSYTPESDSEYYSTTSVENNTYAPQFIAHFHGTGDDRTMARKVKRWIAESFNEMIDEMERSNPSVREV